MMKRMLLVILLACAMAVCVRLVLLLGLSDWATLLIQIPLGAAIYVAFSALFRVDSFLFLLSILRRLRDNRRPGAQNASSDEEDAFGIILLLCRSGTQAAFQQASAATRGG